MQALCLTGDRVCYVDNAPPPQPGPDEALLEVTLAGICGTDLELVAGYTGTSPGILGHEFVGVIERAPDPAWHRRRVTATINVGCRTCPECLASGPEHCPQRTVIGIRGRSGAFADYVAVPVSNLVAVPDAVSDRQAVFTEPLAAALRIREQIAVPPAARAAVIGPGRLGMLVARVLALAGTRVLVVGHRPDSLDLARTWGLDVALTDDVSDRTFDLVVDTTGAPAGFARALDLVRPRGTVIVKSTFAGKPPVDMSRVVVAEVTVMGSRCGPFEPALRLLEAGAVAVESLIDAIYPLRHGLKALEHAGKPGIRKVLLSS